MKGGEGGRLQHIAMQREQYKFTHFGLKPWEAMKRHGRSVILCHCNGKIMHSVWDKNSVMNN